jgi:phosphoribosylformimino-5-aminoimidazole carboxamide ribotide isomerase
VLVVPVIDLMGGHVVHARRGDRSNYRPLASALVPSSDPLDVVAALLAFAPFPMIYAADLDAILQRGGHRDLLLHIAERFPALTLWVDAGFANAHAAAPWFGARRLVPVIGSESLTSSQALAAMLAARPDAILSLDTRGEQPLGPPALFEEPERWPERVIVMTLDRVGAGQGPAFARLASMRSRAPGKKLIAAGGVRDASDLDALDAAGVHAVLVASALHDGSLDRATLSRFL